MSGFPKSVLAVAGVTIAHGGDNIAIYVPFLATQTTVRMFTIVAVFFMMTGVWAVLARWFVRHPAWGQPSNRGDTGSYRGC